MKKVLTVGVFDFFHIGHLNVLLQARSLGEYLIVAVHDDKSNSKGVEFLYDLETRMKIVGNLRIVDETLKYERVDKLVESVKFDIFVCGPDQNHEYFQKAFLWCKEHNKEIVVANRTEGISSSKLRNILKAKKL